MLIKAKKEVMIKLIICFVVAAIVGGVIGHLTSPGDYPWFLKLILYFWIIILLFYLVVGIATKTENNSKKSGKISERYSEGVDNPLKIESTDFANKIHHQNKEKEAFGERTREFVVYLARSSGLGTDRFLVNEEELHSKFLSNKEEYDIVVYQQNTEVKSANVKDSAEEIIFESIELYSNILNLFILFLKYKDEPLPFLELYHCVWKDSAEYESDATEPDSIIDDLKTGVSSLRKKLEIVKNFKIPNAKRNEKSYVCRGNFKFCLVLKKSTDQKYTLEED